MSEELRVPGIPLTASLLVALAPHVIELIGTSTEDVDDSNAGRGEMDWNPEEGKFVHENKHTRVTVLVKVEEVERS